MDLVEVELVDHQADSVDLRVVSAAEDIAAVVTGAVAAVLIRPLF